MDAEKFGKWLMIIGVIIAIPGTILVSFLTYYFATQGTFHQLSLMRNFRYIFFVGLIVLVIGYIYYYQATHAKKEK